MKKEMHVPDDDDSIFDKYLVDQIQAYLDTGERIFHIYLYVYCVRWLNNQILYAYSICVHDWKKCIVEAVNYVCFY